MPHSHTALHIITAERSTVATILERPTTTRPPRHFGLGTAWEEEHTRILCNIVIGSVGDNGMDHELDGSRV
jgi:hypothetical protein